MTPALFFSLLQGPAVWHNPIFIMLLLHSKLLAAALSPRFKGSARRRLAVCPAASKAASEWELRRGDIVGARVIEIQENGAVAVLITSPEEASSSGMQGVVPAANLTKRRALMKQKYVQPGGGGTSWMEWG